MPAYPFIDVKLAQTSQLVAEYNRLTGKSIKKFSSRAAGEKQVQVLLDKLTASDQLAVVPKKKPKTKANTKIPADRSEAIRKSWSDKATHDARSQRTQVSVAFNGTKTVYRSTSAAFKALELPMGSHIKFRMALKAEGSKVFEHDGKNYKFTAVSQGEIE
jgi:hypothetical protein